MVHFTSLHIPALEINSLWSANKHWLSNSDRFDATAGLSGADWGVRMGDWRGSGLRFVCMSSQLYQTCHTRILLIHGWLMCPLSLATCSMEVIFWPQPSYVIECVGWPNEFCFCISLTCKISLCISFFKKTKKRKAPLYNVHQSYTN